MSTRKFNLVYSYRLVGILPFRSMAKCFSTCALGAHKMTYVEMYKDSCTRVPTALVDTRLPHMCMYSYTAGLHIPSSIERQANVCNRTCGCTNIHIDLNTRN